jgi:acetate kinase
MTGILTINAGSSSIKFGLYALEGEPALRAMGQVEGIGAQPRITMKDAAGARLLDEDFDAAPDHEAALARIIATLDARFADADVRAVGHRIVHGGQGYAAPVRLDDAILDALEKLDPFAPLHQPHNLAAVRAAMGRFPQAIQVGCFDTAFHRGQPFVAEAFALPLELYKAGVRRYGFHGLSYDYVSKALARIDPARAAGRVVIAHLGNGASMCALLGGKAQGSTMGFTALDGLPMGTRCGQLDPGVLLWLMDQKGMSAAEITDLLYRKSGLKGLSGVSNDMRALRASEAPEAAQAIDYFVSRIRREVGAMAATLGGLDALVFCGGIGEHADFIRSAVCEGMGWMGLALDPARNAASRTLISPDDAAVAVYVIPTDEEIVIARACAALL